MSRSLPMSSRMRIAKKTEVRARKYDTATYMKPRSHSGICQLEMMPPAQKIVSSSSSGMIVRGTRIPKSAQIASIAQSISSYGAGSKMTKPPRKVAKAIAPFEIIEICARRRALAGRAGCRPRQAGMDRRHAQYALSVFSSLNGVRTRM